MIAIDCRVIGSSTGVDYYTRDLVAALARSSEAQPLLLLISDKDQQKWLPTNAAFKTLPPKRVLFDHFRFRNYVADPQIQAVLHPDNTAFLYAHKNSIVVLHDVLPWLHADDILSRKLLLHSRQKVYLTLQQQALKQVKQIITVSLASQKQIQKIFGEMSDKRLTVIPESVDSIFESPPSQSKQDLLHGLGASKYAFYIGGFERNKNVSSLLKAYDQSSYHGDLILGGRLEGYAEAAEVRQLANSLARRNTIHFVGQLSLEKLNAYYHYADFLVYLVGTGGFGRPILEALKAGCPVITSTAPSSREVGGEAAWYIDPSNTKQLADSMARVESLPADEKKILDTSIAKQAAQFDWAKIAAQFWHRINLVINS